MSSECIKSHVKGHMRGSHYVRPYERKGGLQSGLAPHHHPQPDHNGKLVVIKNPSRPSDPSTWDRPDAIATFVPGGPPPRTRGSTWVYVSASCATAYFTS
ncbi:hypothetical protein Tther_02227 [Tepidimonas thermarum]|uniref:Uncharacterized protein n=1 Tax=Tepidimonas thermarum TaxID=335431 RepID=A0A554WXH2_9BURK|nr:hypothetical protein Tther_02227 [Tepidimonas thermarum]